MNMYIDDHNLSTYSWENTKLFEKTLSIVPLFNKFFLQIFGVTVLCSLQGVLY